MLSYDEQRAVRIADGGNNVNDMLLTTMPLETLKEEVKLYQGEDDSWIPQHSHNSHSLGNAMETGSSINKKKKIKKSSKKLSDHLLKSASMKVKADKASTSSATNSQSVESSVLSIEYLPSLEERAESSSSLRAMLTMDMKKKEHNARNGKVSTAGTVNTEATSVTCDSKTKKKKKKKKKRSSEETSKKSQRVRRKDAALVNTIRNSLPSDCSLAQSLQNPAYHASFLDWLIKAHEAQHAETSNYMQPKSALDDHNQVIDSHSLKNREDAHLIEDQDARHDLASLNPSITADVTTGSLQVIPVNGGLGCSGMNSHVYPVELSSTLSTKVSPLELEESALSCPLTVKSTEKAWKAAHKKTPMISSGVLEPVIDGHTTTIDPPTIDASQPWLFSKKAHEGASREIPDASEDSINQPWLSAGAPCSNVAYRRGSQLSTISELSDLASVFHHRLSMHLYYRGVEESSTSTEEEEGIESDTDSVTNEEQYLEIQWCDNQAVVVTKRIERQDETREALPVRITGTKFHQKVAFSTVYVRRYSTIMGDNPSCTEGPSLSIGWKYEKEGAFDVDDYECDRPGNVQVDLLLSRQERESILRKIGYSDKDIVDSIRSLIRAKNQRRKTVQNLGAEALEAMVQSAGRKMKRLFIPIGRR